MSDPFEVRSWAKVGSGGLNSVTSAELPR